MSKKIKNNEGFVGKQKLCAQCNRLPVTPGSEFCGMFCHDLYYNHKPVMRFNNGSVITGGNPIKTKADIMTSIISQESKENWLIELLKGIFPSAQDYYTDYTGTHWNFGIIHHGSTREYTVSDELLSFIINLERRKLHKHETKERIVPTTPEEFRG